MIKVESDKIYMTAGEICHVLEVRDNMLYSAYFGKRIELEDDLVALCGNSDIPEFAPDISAGKKKFKLEYAGAGVLDAKPHRASALDGGKTLAVNMRSKTANVTADIYYTPYPRGGFSRRVVLFNGTDETLSVKGCNALKFAGNAHIATVTNNGDIVYSDKSVSKSVRSVDNFALATVGDAAYGFLSVYGDGMIEAVSADGIITADCRESDCVSLAPREKYTSPELLYVYSDSGEGGASRILHDVMREAPGGKFLAERRPIVLFCPPLPGERIVGAVNATYELGCDVFCADAGAVDLNTFKAAGEACKAAGLKLGIKLDPYKISKSGAVFGPACKKISDDGYACDFTTQNGVYELLAVLAKIIDECGAEYLMIDLPRGGIQNIARGVYSVRHALRQRFAELNVEWGIVPHELAHGRLLSYPPCMMRTVVTAKGKLKSEFDAATFGCLGYALDPTAVSADIKRAIRAQIFSYQNDAPIVMLGDVYFVRSSSGDVCLMSVTKDKSQAYVVCERSSVGNARVFLDGLDEHNLYHVRELDKTFSGAALVNCGVPMYDAETVCLHIRQVADYEL